MKRLTVHRRHARIAVASCGDDDDAGSTATGAAGASSRDDGPQRRPPRDHRGRRRPPPTAGAATRRRRADGGGRRRDRGRPTAGVRQAAAQPLPRSSSRSTEIPVSGSSPPRCPSRARRVYWLEGNIQSILPITGGFEAATEALGWDLTTITYDPSDPQGPNAAMQQAVDADADFIAISGQPVTAIETASRRPRRRRSRSSPCSVRTKPIPSSVSSPSWVASTRRPPTPRTSPTGSSRTPRAKPTHCSSPSPTSRSSSTPSRR